MLNLELKFKKVSILPPHPADTDTTMLIKVANKNAIPWHMPWGASVKVTR